MEIARALATSQAPVREALKELEARELIVTEAYRGTYVREITQRDMVEAYHVRAALEELSGQQAALALRGNTATLRATAVEAEAMATQNDAQGYAHVDFGFHRAIVQAAGNRLLLRSWDALAFETRIEMLLRRSKLDLSQSVAEHHEIVRAIEEGRGEDAGALLRAHSLHFAAMIAPDHNSA